MMYSLDEITLVPSTQSWIKSRKDINVLTKEDNLPIFVAPMTCIIDVNNFNTFKDNKVIPIFPVHHLYSFDIRKTWSKDSWVAFTLQEVKDLSEDKSFDGNFVLIDCADGHLIEVFNIAKAFKSIHPNCKLMTGNIANPNTYYECCKAGIDYVRVGIGGGSGCTTSVQSGFHTSLSWLITECHKIQKVYLHKEFQTKIIADGGVNTIDKAIKCLALGADYVMMGKCFAQCSESCAKLFSDENKKYYYGQASIDGQIDRFGMVKSNPEGIGVKIPVTGSIQDFLMKFQSALKTAMSYANAQCLDDFIGKVRWEAQTINEFNSYYK